MIPVWVWDNRRRTYVTLPAPPQQFKSGNWGWTKEQYFDNQKIEDFALCHSHLLDFIPDHVVLGLASLTAWDRVELKLKEPSGKVKWYSKAAARITKVQR